MEDSSSIYRTSWDEESRSNILAGFTLGALAFEYIEKGTATINAERQHCPFCSFVAVPIGSSDVSQEHRVPLRHCQKQMSIGTRRSD